VWVFYNHGEQGGGDLTGGRVEAGPDGRFVIDSLPKGCTFTIYSPKGYAPFKDQSLPLDTESEVLVTLEAASIVRGRVVDTVTRKSVVPYRIRIMISNDRRPDEPAPGMFTTLIQEGLIITKSDGEFEFGDFPRGTPLRLMVTADGYQERAVDRVIALPNDEFKPIEIRILKRDPATVRTVLGRLTNADGKPVAGAQVRLWTATSAPGDLARFPFNWTMITCGQLEQNESCRQFLTASTDENGRFRFSGVRVEFYAEIDYWGTGIAPGRERVQFPADAPQAIDFNLRGKAPARLVVEVDREAWPQAAQIMISAQQPTFSSQTEYLRAGKSEVTFDDLPPGTFQVDLQNAGRGLGANRIAIDTLSHREVNVKSGETVTVRFAKP
jgi:hypothetical protein